MGAIENQIIMHTKARKATAKSTSGRYNCRQWHDEAREIYLADKTRIAHQTGAAPREGLRKIVPGKKTREGKHGVG